MTLDLLLFAITFTIFLEIEFDFSFYVRYRSEEIAPAGTNLTSAGPGLGNFKYHIHTTW